MPRHARTTALKRPRFLLAQNGYPAEFTATESGCRRERLEEFFRPGTIGLLLTSMVWILLVSIASGYAQPPAPDREPELIVPKNGIVRRGDGRRVTVSNADDSRQVALVHAEVGDRRLIIRPNGRLDSLLSKETESTNEPFRAASKEAIAAELKQNGFERFKSRHTARYVYVYNTSEEFCKGTSRILETMYPAIVAYFKRQKFEVHEPTVPLVAIMFRTEEEFQKYDAVPSGTAAYYSPISNQIVMYEQSRLVEVAPELAMKQSIGTIAHEGIHQIMHNIGVQERLSRWPTWTAEGLAEYFAPTSVDARLRWKGVGMPHDLRMYELDRFLKHGSATRGEMIESTVGAVRLTSTGYASAWALTHFLASKRKDKFHAYLREVARLGPLEPRDEAHMGADQKRLFTQFFGSNYGALEDDLVKHLKSLPYTDPVLNQTHYVVTLNTNMSRSVAVTASPAAVRQWQESALTKIPLAVRQQATFQIQPFANKALAEEYASELLRVK